MVIETDDLNLKIIHLILKLNTYSIKTYIILCIILQLYNLFLKKMTYKIIHCFKEKISSIRLQFKNISLHPSTFLSVTSPT